MTRLSFALVLCVLLCCSEQDKKPTVLMMFNESATNLDSLELEEGEAIRIHSEPFTDYPNLPTIKERKDHADMYFIGEYRGEYYLFAIYDTSFRLRCGEGFDSPTFEYIRKVRGRIHFVCVTG